MLSIEVESRGAALRHRQRVAAGVRAVDSRSRISRNRGGGGAHAGGCGVLSARQMARHRAARWAGDAAQEYLADVRETDPIYAREGLGHPGLLQRVMNKVLVDNAILGPWIHVGSRMQFWRRREPAMN